MHVQPLPKVTMPAATETTASGLSLVTDAAGVAAVLAADERAARDALPSNRNSCTPPAAEAAAPDDASSDEAATDAAGGSAPRGRTAGGSAAADTVADGALSLSSMLSGLGEGRQGSGAPPSDAAFDASGAEAAAQERWQQPAKAAPRTQKRGDGDTWAKYAEQKRRRAKPGAGRGREGSPRVGGGIKIPAGGAPAGSRLGAMVGDTEYYEMQAKKEKASVDAAQERATANGSS